MSVDPRAIEVEGVGRGAFLVRGALATAGLYGAAAVGPYVRAAFGQGVVQEGGPGATGDLQILGYALLLERMEAEFYERALSGAGLGGEARSLAEQIGENERQHVEKLSTLIDVLGGRPERPPRFTFPLGGQGGFLSLAQTLEETGVSAYNGAAPELRSFEVLEAVGGIVQVEARHAAAIRRLRGEDPAPGAFSPTLPRNRVLAQIRPYRAG